MDIDSLINAGLTKNEAKVYVSLIKLGSATAEEIAKKTGMHRRSTYDCLKGLNKKGMLGNIIKNGKKVYEAAHPNQLLSILKEKEISINNLLPELINLKENSSKKNDASIYYGFEGIKLIFDDIIETGQLNSAFSTVVPEKFLPLVARWHKKRIKQKVQDRVIFSRGELKRGVELGKKKFTKIKFFPAGYDPKISVNIYGDKIGMIIWYDTDNPVCIKIRNKRAAESFRNYFEFMWNQSKFA